MTCGPPGALRSFEPWITATRLLRRSAYLSCAFMLAVAEIKLGRDSRLAQARDEPLIIRHRVRVAVEREHDDGAGRLGRRDDRAFDRAQSAASRRETPIEKPVAGTGVRRGSGRRGRRSARRRRPSRSGPAGLIARRLERELRLEDGAGVIFEPAHDGGVDANCDRDRSRRRGPVPQCRTSSSDPDLRSPGRPTSDERHASPDRIP